MKNKKMIIVFLIGAMLLMFVGCGKSETAESTYPEKTIEIICPFGTGGDTDALCRSLADEMGKELGVSVMVTNMTGGAGSVASNYVKDAANDGYRVFWCHNTLCVNDICGISDYNHDAFEPAVLCAQSSALCVFTNGKFKSVEEIVNYAKGNPGQLNVGVVSGGITEIMAIAFCDAVGIEANYVDCGSGNDMNVEMVAGRIDVCVNTFGTVSEYYKSGDIIPVAVMGNERLALCDTAPTMTELGYDKVEGDMYYGFYFPKGTDEKVIDTFNAAAKKAVESSAYKEILSAYAYKPVYIEKKDATSKMDAILEYYKQYESLLGA